MSFPRPESRFLCGEGHRWVSWLAHREVISNDCKAMATVCTNGIATLQASSIFEWISLDTESVTSCCKTIARLHGPSDIVISVNHRSERLICSRPVFAAMQTLVVMGFLHFLFSAVWRSEAWTDYTWLHYIEPNRCKTMPVAAPHTGPVPSCLFSGCDFRSRLPWMHLSSQQYLPVKFPFYISANAVRRCDTHSFSFFILLSTCLLACLLFDSFACAYCIVCLFLHTLFRPRCEPCP